MLLLKQTKIYHDWLKSTGYKNDLKSLHLFLLIFKDTMEYIEGKYRKEQQWIIDWFMLWKRFWT